MRSRIHFDDSCEMDRLERWGSTETRCDRLGFVWCVFSSVLERALADANFDRQKTLRRMADEGLLLLSGSGRGFTRQRRFTNGSRVYCVCIDNTALEELFAGSTGDTTAVLGACEVKPC